VRSAEASRKTLETQVTARVNLDGSGTFSGETGIGFLDHMLSQLARHGVFDIEVHAEGDLEVDSHHTVEDVAITLGQAFNQALGDRNGIVRMGSAAVPMEEALALAAVDAGGRPACRFEGGFAGDRVGEMDTQLIPHFLDSFARTARANVHIHLLSGDNDHHRAEAAFKALARALDQATALDPRRAGQAPSTKGTLT